MIYIHAQQLHTHTGSEGDHHLPRVVGVAVELARGYHSKLPSRSSSQTNLLTDAKLLIDVAKVTGGKDPDGVATVVFAVVDGVRGDT